MGITIFKILIWGGISFDIRSEITFYGSARHGKTKGVLASVPRHGFSLNFAY